MKTLQTPLLGLAILALAVPHDLPAANVPARPLQSLVEGDWKPLAATKEKPFASPANVRDGATHWTDSFSHGELLRAGYDEKMEVDPTAPQVPFPGRQRFAPRREKIRRDPMGTRFARAPTVRISWPKNGSSRSRFRLLNSISSLRKCTGAAKQSKSSSSLSAEEILCVSLSAPVNCRLGIPSPIANSR